MNELEVVALCGGIGGAKLALGFYHVLEIGKLAVIVNTGDDFEHLGFRISPDLDTVIYTLAGVADPERGWGRAQETWGFMNELRHLGGESWFNLGDRDLAMHVVRTEWLRRGGTLSGFANRVTAALGVTAKVLPMSDDVINTVVQTTEGDIPFQNYFVQMQCVPAAKGFRFEGAEAAKPSPGILDLLSGEALGCIVLCPSNPYLSIDPILSVPGIRDALAASVAPVIAVSPIVGGQAVKGPTTKIMDELGIATNSKAIAEHYRGLIDGLIIDNSDVGDIAGIDIPIMPTATMMRNLADRKKLAADVIQFSKRLTKRFVLGAAEAGE